MKPFKLYTLNDPDTREIRYVGITSKEVSVRLHNHLTRMNHNPHRWYWIQKLKREGKTPTHDILLIGLSFQEACRFEIEMISALRNAGFNLTNICNGGEAPNFGRKFSIEARKNMARSRIGRKYSLETRLKMSRSSKGRVFSEEHRRKMRESAKYRPPISVAQKEALAAGRKNRLKK